MPSRFRAILYAASLPLLVLPRLSAQPAPPADDPLPKGASVRFGITRPILRTGPEVALIPPKYTNFLAPTMTGVTRRYDLGTGRPLDKKGIVGPGRVEVSADGKRAAVARPGALSVIEVETGKLILAVQPPDGVLIVGTPGVSLSADGTVLAFGVQGQDRRGEAVVMDVDKNEVLAQCETNQQAPIYLTLSRDGKTLATYGPPAKPPTFAADPKPKAPETPIPADALRTAQVWEIASSRELFKARVTGMGGIVVTAAFAPDGDTLAASCGDGPVDVFEVKTGKRIHSLLGRKGQGVRVAISPDGKKIASIGPNYQIQQWASDGKPLGISEAPPGVLIAPITALIYTDNERPVAWITAALFCVAWEAPSGKLLSPEMDHQAAIRTVAFPAGAKDVYTSGFDGKAFRWNLGTGGLNEEIQFHPARLPGAPLLRPVVALSADGTRAIRNTNPAEIFDCTTGDNLFCVPPTSAPPAPTLFQPSPDGLKLIVTSRQADKQRMASCVVWDLLSQKRLAEFEIVPNATLAAPLAVLSPSGNRLVVATVSDRPDGGQALLIVGYDMKTGKKLAEVEDRSGAGKMTISVVAASDTTLLIANNLGRVYSVDYENGKIEDDIDKVAAQGEPPLSGPVVVSPDGKRFATGIVGEPFTTYGVRVYDLATRKVVRSFIGHAGPVSAIRFSPDSNAVASGAQDTSVLLWDLRDPEEK